MAGTASKHRSWVSPITTACFLALGISGLLMMFHIRSHGLHVLHEGMGILFCLVGVFHLVLNWRVLVGYLRTRKGMIAAVAIVLLGGLMVLGGNEHAEESHGGHDGPPTAHGDGPEI